MNINRFYHKNDLEATSEGTPMDQKTVFHISSELVLFGGMLYYMQSKNLQMKKELSDLRIEMDDLRELVEDHSKSNTSSISSDVIEASVNEKIQEHSTTQQKLTLQFQQFQQQNQIYQNQQQVQQQTMLTQIQQLQQQLHHLRTSGVIPPSHNVPSHNVPSHNVPSHNVPSHNAPSHNAPSHNVPSHNAPSHNAQKSHEDVQKNWEADQLKRKQQEEEEHRKQEFMKSHHEQWLKSEQAHKTQALVEQEELARKNAHQQAQLLAQRQQQQQEAQRQQQQQEAQRQQQQQEAQRQQIAQRQHEAHMAQMAHMANVTVTAIPIFQMGKPQNTGVTIEEYNEQEENDEVEIEAEHADEIDEIEIDAEVEAELEKLEQALNQPSVSKSRTKIITPPKQKSKTRSKSGQKKKRGRKAKERS